MIDPSVLRALQATGATIDMIIAVVEADALVEKQRLADRRAKDVVRQRKSRASRAVTVTPSDRSDSENLVPKEYISNPPNPSSAKAEPSPLPERVLKAWNDGPAKAGARVARPSGKPRANAIRLRIAEHGEAAVFEMIANVAASEFHCGKGERGWRANLDWTLEPKNFQKMLELAPARTVAKPSGPLDGSDFAELQAGNIDNAEFERRRAEKLARAPPSPPSERRNGSSQSVGDAIRDFNRRNIAAQQDSPQ